MRQPKEGEELRTARGQVWVVLRCHVAGDDPRFFAVDLVAQEDCRNPSRSVNLTWDEFEEFCAQNGIEYPAA